MSRTLAPHWGLAALCLPMLLVSMDVSILFFTVPDIAADLKPSPAQQLWIFDVYGFVLAGLLVPMGALADRIGHRRLLMIGATGFGAASALAGLSTSASMLVVARALLGVAGATLMPSTLALIRDLFDDEDARRKAVAVWNAVLTGGVALGPILSGVLLEHFWWGSVFLINVPVMLALLVAAPLLLPANTAVAGRSVDLLSAALALGAVLPLIYGIKTIASDGWSAVLLVPIVAGLILGVVFVRRQRSLADPMIDVTLFRDRRFGASIMVNLLCMFALLGNSVAMTQYLQSVLGYAPLKAALWSIAPSLVVGAAAPLAAVAAGRFGRVPVMVAGLAVSASGFAVIGGLTGVDTLIPILVGAGLVASGVVAVTTMVADHVIGVAPAGRAGATSALLETSSELGGALGIALLGSVINAVFRAVYPGDLPGGDDGLAGALAAARNLPADTGTRVIDAARHAFTDGVTTSAWCAAALLLLTAVITGWALRTPASQTSSRESDSATSE
ncbi:MFS transporter [Gordonia amarae]|uniref:MFS transporter n=2 Tax=Gordonia amarae TaxID=36821 RepID=A0A857L6S7_9ACTN|nr:MFS transporter [Gordonia amarae]MCS3876405.1 DHA2 family multidrug resistance protein-like MFS transporter [Gordonia amarae]QHN19321.1 MFS transporter [Gordonia amarae]QHN23797.1 MFS transporter [Gordonia amarae]QHN32707.1 MFS transporter [Gordonia amarae]QHN41456.1 MFS transporter [Gordonia amarae]